VDRRHVALGVALVATIADSYPEYSAYEGSAEVAGPSFVLDEDVPERAFLIRATVTIPPVGSRDSASAIGVDATVDWPDAHRNVHLVFEDCETGEGIAEGSSNDEDVVVPDPFGNCVHGYECEVEVCLVARPGEEIEELRVSFTAYAGIRSLGYVGDEDEIEEAPMTIEVEELE
jgi:hypothetical protein